MSFATLTTASRDPALLDRTAACVQQQARDNPGLADTDTAAAVRAGDTAALASFTWPVVLNTEVEYEFAVNAGHPAPIGEDEAVIPDAMILSAVQASWPATWPPV